MPTIKRILCPVDFSDTAAVAAREAAQLARAAGAELLLIHAVDQPFMSGSTKGYQAPVAQQYEMIVRKKLEAAASALRLLSPVRPMIVHGDVDDAIAHAATQHSADVIVMGGRQRKGIARILGDSMTERVMRRARVPVVRVSPAELRRPPMQHAHPHGTA